MSRKKIIVLGNGDHGKDTTAEIIEKLYGHTFTSSSMVANELFIYDALKDKYGYNNPQECYLDRRNHRAEWYDLIHEYNRKDKARLAKEIFKLSDIYVGMRDNEECQACISQGIVDLVIGVYDPRKPLEPYSSFNINIWEQSHFIIPNASSLGHLESIVGKLKGVLT